MPLDRTVLAARGVCGEAPSSYAAYMGRGVGRATTLVSVVLAGCGSSLPPPPPSAAALVLVPSGATIARGDRLTLKAYLRRPDGSLREVTSGVQWRSTRPRIAAVGDGGLAVARRSGSARIRASVDGHRAVARATVVRAPRALKVSPANPRYFEDAAGRMVYLAGRPHVERSTRQRPQRSAASVRL